MAEVNKMFTNEKVYVNINENLETEQRNSELIKSIQKLAKFNSVFFNSRSSAVYHCLLHKEDPLHRLHKNAMSVIVNPTQTTVISDTNRVQIQFKLRKDNKTVQFVAICVVLCTYLPKKKDKQKK
jgi:hypothetical protein